MSAWVVSDEHINVLLWAGMRSRPNIPLVWYFGNPTQRGSLDYDTADEVGQMLRNVNIDSVNHRYNGPEPGTGVYPEYRYRQPLCMSWTPVEVLKAIECYEYQTCEIPGWHDSEAYAFCRELRFRMIAALPGYDTAPWVINRSTRPAR